MRVGAYRAAILGAAFSAVTLGFANQVSAQEVPPGCNFAGAGASMTRFPATNVIHGQEVCYRIQYSNGAPGVNCEIRNFDADLVLPDGTSIPMFAGVTIVSGEVVFCPSGDPRCVTASNCTIAGQDGYRYIVNHADEVLSFVGCPPQTTAGIGRIVAYTEGLGDSLTNPPDVAAACATANNIVLHACCEPCTGTCTEVLAAGNCPSPSTFTEDRNCAEVTCTPLVCAGPVPPCEAGQFCNPATGTCANLQDPPFSTPCVLDENACTTDHCDGLGSCVRLSTSCDTPNFCDDGNTCTEDACDINVEGCCTHGDIPCPPPPVCFTRGLCDSVTGCPDPVSDCVTNPALCEDNNACTRDICNVSAPGCCRHEDIPCEEPPVCHTRGPCDAETGCAPIVSVCDDPTFSCPPGSVCNPEAPDCCEVTIQETCRTPGFWGTHACGRSGGPFGTTGGCEKRNSNNLTLAALTACGGCVNVCGDIIDTTVLNDSDSALEAMCVAVNGTQVRQLARQLTSAALNCCISGSDASCGGISVEPFFTACNAACALGNTTASVNDQTVNCIDVIDDFNNGRISDCHERNVGLCSNGAICTEQVPCVTGNCGPHGPAGSSNACNAATGNGCYVIGTTNCADGSNAPQSCP